MLPTAPALEKRQAHADRATWGKPRNCSSALRLPGGWGVSFSADVQNPPGRVPVGSDLGVPALPEGLDWVICQGPFWSLTFCDFLRMFLKSSLGACAWRKAQGLLIVLPTSPNTKWIRALPVEVVADLMTTHPCFLSQVAEHPEPSPTTHWCCCITQGVSPPFVFTFLLLSPLLEVKLWG